MKRSFCAVSLIAIGVFQAAQADNYDISDLGVLSSGDASFALSTSADGTVIVGAADASTDESHAVKWEGGAGPIDIGTSAYLYSAATDVSADGSIIVGWVQIDTRTPQQAVIWQDDDMDDLVMPVADQASVANAISDDKTVIVGWSGASPRYHSAIKWEGADYSQWTRLATPNAWTQSEANDVSADGTVIVGWAGERQEEPHAVKWVGSKSIMTELDSLGGDSSVAAAVSSDGAIIVGWAALSGGDIHAVKWVGVDSMTANDLGTFGGADSYAFGISANGRVVVGQADTAAGDTHAAVWTDDAAEPTDLGTFGGSNSVAYAASEDGSIIVGGAEIGTGAQHAALWKKITPPGPYIPIDVTNTAQTVANLAKDTFSVIEMQRLALGGLQRFCDVRKSGETCYALEADAIGFSHTRDVRGHVAMAHAFSDHFSAGASLSYSLWRNLPNNFGNKDNNIGAGLYAQWKEETQSGYWYLRGSVAANRYDVNRTRQILGYTEAGKGTSAIKGWGGALELGQSLDLENNAVFGYYGGLRYSDLRMDGYTETDAYVPFTYSSVDYAMTSVYAGVKYGVTLTDKVRWSVNAEIEQDLSHKDPTVSAHADYIGTLAHDASLAHTRGSLSTTISYAIKDHLHIGVTPYVVRTATRDTGFGAILGLSGTF